MHILNAHSSNQTAQYTAQFEASLKDDRLSFSFEVSTVNDAFHCSSEFALDHFQNWGMWDYDVMEFFIANCKDAPYLELQLSPLNQAFALIITEPRKSWHYPSEWSEFDHRVEVVKNVWKGSISIEVEKIPNFKNGDSLFINAFGVFGSDKEYYAWNPNPEKTPDHHRPELFKEFKC